MQSLFDCKECKENIDIFKIKTKKQIDDLHDHHLCSKCSDKIPLIHTIEFKKRKKNQMIRKTDI